MERLSVAFLLLCVFCGIRFSASDRLEDSQYFQQALSEFQNRYEHTVKKLESEITSFKAAEKRLVAEIRKLKQSHKLTEAKFAIEIDELKQNRLQDLAVISKLKTELKHTNEEFGALKIRMDKCDATNNEQWSSKFDDMKPFDPEKEQTETKTENISKLINVDVPQENAEKLNPNKGKETPTQYGASNPNYPKEMANKEGKDKSPETKVNKRLLNNLNGNATHAHVAFFARLSNHSQKLQPGQDIVFSEVVTNIGKGYHGLHGNFVAPVAGMYVFHASLLSLGGHVHASLMKNGQEMAKFDIEQTYYTNSHMVVIELNAGDDVAVKNADYPDKVYYGHHYSTFSGFLLYAYQHTEIPFVGK